ncbi:maleylpyruvate isomerase family mycothiol-dependent enzyme [Actinocorallia sp. A-T 12471]|uniref:maleylpyruvate isomerase family mycothiol-dependent enzyme n=1 Tax=Actinocorallia sp. A-T 12471 TaxID=3089813 RepID=UPI0029D3BB60|nr:maleylpyruvate isomerase family mycothiol-dependent enzyme [Actinocorallia sp. A-T 12471]MDX6740380.1 maleylpyruvate isomerase family mycothiol-dependent enzyme [Actinocorallia sp. A-T 12471]
MTARAWMDEGTALFLSTLDDLSDDDLDAPSALPGWTRKHLVAHVHYNAEALRRLVSWAATGVENRMYAGPEQRNAEIEAGALLPAARLREMAHASAAALAADMDALPEAAWGNPVVTALGRTVPAAETPWMRTREVSIHAVDLAAGASFADLPQEVNAAIAADALATHAARGHAADLAAWLTGRADRAPAVGSWI